MRIALVATAIVAGTVPAFGAELDHFFGDFPSCVTSNEFDYLLRINLMRHVFADQNYDSARLPAHIEAALTFDRASEMSDHIEVTYRVTGTYENQPLSGLTLWIGKENGIAAASLEFDLSSDAVKMWFAEKVAKTNERAANAGPREAPPRAVIPDTDPGTIFCDWST